MKMKEIHSCEQLKLAEAWLEYADDECIFNICQNATEEDLMNNHHLEIVGETIIQVSLGVSYCPYCGTRLQSSTKKEPPSFNVYDFSK